MGIYWQAGTCSTHTPVFSKFVNWTSSIIKWWRIAIELVSQNHRDEVEETTWDHLIQPWVLQARSLRAHCPGSHPLALDISRAGDETTTSLGSISGFRYAFTTCVHLLLMPFGLFSHSLAAVDTKNIGRTFSKSLKKKLPSIYLQISFFLFS